MKNRPTFYIDEGGKEIAVGLGALKHWLALKGLTSKDILKIPVGVKRWKQATEGNEWDYFQANIVMVVCA